MVALGIFIVNAWSLVVWRARYESKISSRYCAAPDFVDCARLQALM
jgi:hypothetical protein